MAKIACSAVIVMILLAGCGDDVSPANSSTTTATTSTTLGASTAAPTTTEPEVPLMELIVTLAVEWQPEANLTEDEVAAQRDRIASAQQEVVGLLEGTSFEVVRLFVETPQLALAVDAEARARLEASELIGGVVDDVPEPAN